MSYCFKCLQSRPQKTNNWYHQDEIAALHSLERLFICLHKHPRKKLCVFLKLSQVIFGERKMCSNRIRKDKIPVTLCSFPWVILLCGAASDTGSVAGGTGKVGVVVLLSGSGCLCPPPALRGAEGGVKLLKPSYICSDEFCLNYKKQSLVFSPSSVSCRARHWNNSSHALGWHGDEILMVIKKSSKVFTSYQPECCFTSC